MGLLLPTSHPVQHPSGLSDAGSQTLPHPSSKKKAECPPPRPVSPCHAVLKAIRTITMSNQSIFFHTQPFLFKGLFVYLFLFVLISFNTFHSLAPKREWIPKQGDHPMEISVPSWMKNTHSQDSRAAILTLLTLYGNVNWLSCDPRLPPSL